MRLQGARLRRARRRAFYRQASLPHLIVWRSYQSGVFALGIEPGTVMPRVEEGKLVGETLPPRGSRETVVAVTIVPGGGRRSGQ